MQADLERILIERSRIAQRIDELAQQIAADYAPKPGEDHAHITLVPILTGSIIFVADLIRRLPLPMQVRVMSVSSYPGKATTSQGVTHEPSLSSLPESLVGRNVLIVDDILDSGNTLNFVTQLLQQRNPDSLRTCVLLRKQREQAMAFSVDYVAFDIPDEFVVGYGLDYDGYYRNLPDIGVLKPDVPQAKPNP